MKNLNLVFETVENQKIWSVHIKSLKNDRQFILINMAKNPEIHHVRYHDRIYTASDLYRKF